MITGGSLTAVTVTFHATVSVAPEPSSTSTSTVPPVSPSLGVPAIVPLELPIVSQGGDCVSLNVWPASSGSVTGAVNEYA